LFVADFAQLGMTEPFHGVFTHAALVTELEDLAHPVTVFVCAIRRAREESEIVCCSHVFGSYICRQRTIRSLLKTQCSSSGVTPHLRQSDACSADFRLQTSAGDGDAHFPRQDDDNEQRLPDSGGPLL
jgi:hypothetical protein